VLEKALEDLIQALLEALERIENTGSLIVARKEAGELGEKFYLTGGEQGILFRVAERVRM